MAPEVQEEPSLGRRIRHQMRVYRLALSVFVFVLGIALMTLAIGYFSPLGSSTPFSQVNSVTAPNNSTNYNLIFVIAGPIIFIIGAYFVGVYYLARRKFEHLMETKSKAEFLRNLPELEDLLWDLTPNDEVRYAEKKAELRVRR
ncbi:MAG TPA: DUF3198 domain-containing protein [Thermoplasmata archaeon]|nr:DUF3198 domain-containing protein [Thermoplasmata archaeon]